MLTNSQFMNKLLIFFYNFCSITSVKINNNQLIHSKCSAFFKLIFFIILSYVNNFVVPVYFDYDESFFSEFSPFSNAIFYISMLAYYSYTLIVVFLQTLKLKQIAHFLQKFFTKKNYLNAKHEKKFLKSFKVNVALIMGVQILCTVSEEVSYINYEIFVTYIAQILTAYSYAPNLGLIIFMYNFKQFMLEMLEELKEELKESATANVSEILYKLIEISNTFKEFNEIFSIQLSICVFANSFILTFCVRF